jgi:replicative DNA helicase
MSSEQIGTRILADAAHVDISKIRAGTLTQVEEEKLTDASDAIARAKIYVDDSSALSPLEIRSRCRRLKQEQGLDMVVIDYIQLLSAIRQQKDANRVMETAEISRTLKQLARELNVPVIALSQLSRNSEYRDGGEPRLADLRDSGSIEQDADVVIMLWRPKEQGDEFYDNVNVKVAKHRNGPIGDLQLVFRKATTSFTTGEQ